MNINNFATCTVAYNDEKVIGGMLKGVEDLYNLVIISTPWRGKHIKFDRSNEIAERMGAEVVYQNFKCEKDERNFGMEYLEKKGFKYIFIVDTDEYYTKENINKMMRYVEENRFESYKNRNDKVYWKTWKYYFQHSGCNSCLRSDIRFRSKRNPETKDIGYFDEGEMHHFTFNRTKEGMLEKIETREYGIMTKAWLEKYWINWQPGEDYKDFKIVPTTNIPEKILGRYVKSINLLY